MSIQHYTKINFPMNFHKNNLLPLVFVLFACTLIACSNSRKQYSSPEDELNDIITSQGWTEKSNVTNVYFKYKDYSNGGFKLDCIYTVQVYYRGNGIDREYIAARVIYKEENQPKRDSNGNLEYRTLSIIPCNYTDNIGRSFNGYIHDIGFTGYLNY